MTPELDQILKTIANEPIYLGYQLGYDKLLPIHDHWIKDCWTKNDYVLQAHRNSYKTTAVLVVGSIRWLLFNPNDSILIIRKDFESAISLLREITKQYQTNKFLISLFYHIYGSEPVLRSKQDSLLLSCKKIVDSRASIEAISVGGTITGKHFDKVFTDDIVTIKDRTSKAERESTKLFVNELLNIPKPGGTIVHTGTPWHPEDAFSILPKADKYPIGKIQIPGFDQDFILRLKNSMTPSLWAANYELVHISDEGRIFHEPTYGKWPEKLTMIKAWLDPAYEGACTTAVAMIGLDINKIAYVRGWIWDKSVVDVYNNIAERLNEYKCGTLYIEDNADKGASTRDMRKIYPAVIGRNEHMNKHIKIISYLKKNYDKLVFADDCQPEFMNQILDYTEDADLVDAPDALAALIREMKLGDSNILDRF
jgi:hypothetical protein